MEGKGLTNLGWVSAQQARQREDVIISRVANVASDRPLAETRVNPSSQARDILHRCLTSTLMTYRQLTLAADV